mmetsp:Transcript_15732/g.52661  ORF Transcript_15732/g.52661 Transcript_15732/m.52661 type:complete len:620 (+) Transcript_15732:595-2454(+)
MISVHVREASLRFICRSLRLLWPHENVWRRQHCSYREDFIATVVLRACHKHLRQLRIQRKLSHCGAELSKVTIVIQSSEVVEELERSHQSLGGWRIHEVEMHQIVDPQLLQGEHNRPQVRSEHLGVSLLLQLLVECLLSVETEALPWPCTSCTTCSLVRACLRDSRDEQGFYSNPGVVHLLFAESGIDHIDDSINCQGCFCNVGRNHDFPSSWSSRKLWWWSRIENFLLFVRWESGVKRNASYWANFLVVLTLKLSIDLGTGLFDLIFTRQEQKNVSWWLAEVNLHCCADGSFKVVPLCFLGVEDFNWESASRDIDSWAVVEVLLELASIQSGTHDNQLHVLPLTDNLLDEAEEDICRDRPLVGLVQHNTRVALEERVVHGFSEEHTVCHVPEDRVRSCQILETDGVTDLLPELNIHLLSNTPGNTHCSDPSRLCACNAPDLAVCPSLAVATIYKELRDLRCFATPSLSNQHYNLVLAYSLDETLLELIHRKVKTLLQDLVVVLRELAARQRVHPRVSRRSHVPRPGVLGVSSVAQVDLTLAVRHRALVVAFPGDVSRVIQLWGGPRGLLVRCNGGSRADPNPQGALLQARRRNLCEPSSHKRGGQRQKSENNVTGKSF